MSSIVYNITERLLLAVLDLFPNCTRKTQDFIVYVYEEASSDPYDPRSVLRKFSQLQLEDWIEQDVGDLLVELRSAWSTIKNPKMYIDDIRDLDDAMEDLIANGYVDESVLE